LRLTDEGRWWNRELGYFIDAPRSAGSTVDAQGTSKSAASPQRWESIRVSGADLAYRGSDGSLMTLLSECRAVAEARPGLLARQLLIGLGERELVASHPIALRGNPGWQQVFRTLDGSTQLEVRSVTIRGSRCTFDCVWVGRVGAESVRDFERWWSSFERDPAFKLGASS